MYFTVMRPYKMKTLIDNFRGYTLAELLVTIFIAAIAVNLVLGTYAVVIRVWNRYSLSMDASDNAWIDYTKIRTMLSKVDAVKKTAENEWTLYKNVRSVSALTYKNGTLAIVGDSIHRWEAAVDSFSLETVESDYPMVMECRLTCSKGKQRSSLVWRMVCDGGGERNDTLLPTPASNGPIMGASRS